MFAFIERRSHTTSHICRGLLADPSINTPSHHYTKSVRRISQFSSYDARRRRLRVFAFSTTQNVFWVKALAAMIDQFVYDLRKWSFITRTHTHPHIVRHTHRECDGELKDRVVFVVVTASHTSNTLFIFLYIWKNTYYVLYIYMHTRGKMMIWNYRDATAHFDTTFKWAKIRERAQHLLAAAFRFYLYFYFCGQPRDVFMVYEYMRGLRHNKRPRSGRLGHYMNIRLREGEWKNSQQLIEHINIRSGDLDKSSFASCLDYD